MRPNPAPAEFETNYISGATLLRTTFASICLLAEIIPQKVVVEFAAVRRAVSVFKKFSCSIISTESATIRVKYTSYKGVVDHPRYNYGRTCLSVRR